MSEEVFSPHAPCGAAHPLPILARATAIVPGEALEIRLGDVPLLRLAAREKLGLGVCLDRKANPYHHADLATVGTETILARCDRAGVPTVSEFAGLTLAAALGGPA